MLRDLLRVAGLVLQELRLWLVLRELSALLRVQLLLHMGLALRQLHTLLRLQHLWLVLRELPALLRVQLLVHLSLLHLGELHLLHGESLHTNLLSLAVTCGLPVREHAILQLNRERPKLAGLDE